jgi:hypothetical protein
VSFFKTIRVAILLLILFVVAVSQWKARARLSSWEQPVWITIYPMMADSAERNRPYVDSLTPDSFSEIGDFLRKQGSRYGRNLADPIVVQIAAPISERPPPLPAEGDRVNTAIWSLKMRWWAWRREREGDLPGADIQIFVFYQDTRKPPSRERSVGVQNGRYGIVNAFAARAYSKANRVVITHELLHILGATDKYHRATSQPVNPGGLAEPDRKPLYPQKMAEIMGGRIAVSETEAKMPNSLKSCVIGPETAIEIGWN